LGKLKTIQVRRILLKSYDIQRSLQIGKFVAWKGKFST